MTTSTTPGNRTQKTARIATIVVFVAAIRCVSEPFRLAHYATAPLTFAQAMPFVLGALVCVVALLGMTLLSYYGRHTLITVLGAVAVAALLVIKWVYL